MLDELKDLISDGYSLEFISKHFNIIKDTVIYKLRKELNYDGFRDAQHRLLHIPKLKDTLRKGYLHKDMLEDLGISSSLLKKLLLKLNFSSLRESRKYYMLGDK